MATSNDPARARAAARRVVRVLRAAGHQAYFAGGCVRDELLGLKPTDYDVATDATPRHVRALFRPAHLVGEAFGVVLLPIDGQHVEVATFRGEGAYSDSRRPDSVTFGTIDDDAARRDFTINALYLDPEAQPAERTPGVDGRVIDLVGGVPDLNARVLRAVGDPEARLAEDHLRALRAVRFAARLNLTIDTATADAVRRHAVELRGVSRERIGQELQRMLEPPSRAAAVTMLQGFSLDGPALDEPSLQVPVPTVAGLPPTRIAFGVVLAAWLCDRFGGAGASIPPAVFEPVARRWRRALCLSNADRDALAGTLDVLHDVATQFASIPIAKQKRLASRDWFDQGCLLLRTRRPDLGREVDQRVAELAHAGEGVAPDPLIVGDDLISLGLKPGPAFKRWLDEIYDAQLEGRVRTRNQGLQMARELAARSGVQ